MQDSKEIKRRIAGIRRRLLFQLRLLFFPLVSYGRELPEKFRQPPQPALPRLFTVIIKLYEEALPCYGGKSCRNEGFYAYK
jgi:hypothetical protein